MKKYIAVCLVLSFLFNFSFPVYAHTNFIPSQYTVTEQSGWKVNEDKHTNALTAYYGFEAYNNNITPSMKSMVRDGESRWSGTFTFNETTSEPTPYVLITTTDVDMGYASTTVVSKNSSTGHVTRWKIKINLNQANNFNAFVAAHEFGHVIGLADLYDSRNRNKLMYGDLGSSGGVPSAADKNGARVITGVHTSHSMGGSYAAIWGYPSSTPAHMSFCSSCNIGRVESCTPETGTCTKCRKSH